MYDFFVILNKSVNHYLLTLLFDLVSFILKPVTKVGKGWSGQTSVLLFQVQR